MGFVKTHDISRVRGECETAARSGSRYESGRISNWRKDRNTMLLKGRKTGTLKSPGITKSDRKFTWFATRTYSTFIRAKPGAAQGRGRSLHVQLALFDLSQILLAPEIFFSPRLMATNTILPPWRLHRTDRAPMSGNGQIGLSRRIASSIHVLSCNFFEGSNHRHVLRPS